MTCKCQKEVASMKTEQTGSLSLDVKKKKKKETSGKTLRFSAGFNPLTFWSQCFIHYTTYECLKHCNTYTCRLTKLFKAVARWQKTNGCFPHSLHLRNNNIYMHLLLLNICLIIINCHSYDWWLMLDSYDWCM